MSTGVCASPTTRRRYCPSKKASRCPRFARFARHRDGINLTTIADSLTPARNESYIYTAANRLQQGDGIWGSLNWTCDLVGNRTSEALTAGATTTDTYNYPGTSNLLATLGHPIS